MDWWHCYLSFAMTLAKRARAGLHQLERRARECGLQTALDFVCEEIGNGVTLRAICQSLDPPIKPAALRSQLNKMFGEEEVRRRFAAARADGADSLAEKILEIIAGIRDKNDAAKAKIEIEALRWLAAKWNRERYGERAPAPAAQVNLNFGSLLLKAHRDLAGSLEKGPTVAGELPAEIVGEDDNGAEEDGGQDQAAGTAA